jgi:hypothetical protein
MFQGLQRFHVDPHQNHRMTRSDMSET